MFHASAPGSTMLLGEHAVLRGYPSVVGAVNRRVFAELIPKKGNAIHIHSSALGQYETTIETLTVEKPFQFILQALLNHQRRFPSGFDLHIVSEFSSQVGLGSSAAVTVVTIAVIEQWLDGQINLQKNYAEGVHVIRTVQGMGSGADVAASVFGGVLAYQATPVNIESLPIIPAISLIYTGYKTPTPVVVNQVNAADQQAPDLFSELFSKMGECTKSGIKAIRQQNWQQLGKIFCEHQKLQRKIGVSDATIDGIIEACQEVPTIFGAKISGSGLGDCVVILGGLPKDYFPRNEEERQKGICQIDIQITNEGCHNNEYKK